MMSFQFGCKNVFIGFATTDTKCFASIENTDRSVISVFKNMNASLSSQKVNASA